MGKMHGTGTPVRACGPGVCFQSATMFRRVCPVAALAAILLAVACPAFAELDLQDYDRVVVAPTKTSIYLGVVSMTMPAFKRSGSGYEASYVAKVFPFFFYNEAGQLRVEIPDEALRRLARGEGIEFKGRAVTEEGAERVVEGKATPTDSARGRIKVRVFYSKRIQLIFNTTYEFPDARA